jgi:hypothetical protein
VSLGRDEKTEERGKGREGGVASLDHLYLCMCDALDWMLYFALLLHSPFR